MSDFEAGLWAGTVDAARKAGMEFTVPCAHNVRDFIRAGAAAMRRQRRIAEEDCELASAHLDLLAAEMMRTARELEGSGKPGEKIPIRETALVRAKRLCPLWPFG
jgi:hypothetical protein